MYIVKIYGGSYDEDWEFNVGCYASKAKADAVCAELDAQIEKRETMPDYDDYADIHRARVERVADEVSAAEIMYEHAYEFYGKETAEKLEAKALKHTVADAVGTLETESEFTFKLPRKVCYFDFKKEMENNGYVVDTADFDTVFVRKGGNGNEN